MCCAFKTQIKIGKARLVLTDLNGRVVWKKDGILDANVNIDVSKMTSGLYVLSIDNGTHQTYQKNHYSINGEIGSRLFHG